jgi:myo-inositol-1(or 4)-monophosphatase
MLQVAGPQAMIDLLSPDWRERLTRIPHIPSLAYRLAMVASGTLDATFVKPNAHDWDIAAADLILREAGGELTGRDGQAPNYGGEAIRHGALAAGSGELFAALADIVATLDR